MIQQFDTQKFAYVLESPGEGEIPGAGLGVAAGVVVEGNDGEGVIGHGCLEDFPGFDGDGFEAALAQDMEAEEFVFGVEGNDAELFDGFVFEVEEEVQEMVADRWGGDWEIQLVAVLGESDLFEGVNVDGC